MTPHQRCTHRKLTNMSPNLKFLPLPILLCLILIFTIPALAQSEAELVLSFSKDFGYASLSGTDIQGTFGMKASGPVNLVKVVFLIDGKSIGEDSEPPFKVQFTTDSYSLGVHTLSAVGTTSDGQELKSKEYQRNFVSAEEGWKAAMTIAVPILILVLGISLASILGPLLMGRGKKGSLPLGAPRSYGGAGGTVCPKCGRPFAMHLLGLNLLVGKLDHCPYCGKWSLVTHATPTQLKAAEAAELALAAGDTPQVTGMTEEEKLRKELDNSHFQEM